MERAAPYPCRSLPHRQLRNCDLWPIGFYKQFTAAQAAQKDWKPRHVSDYMFTAAQAAQKLVDSQLGFVPRFTAAQAAQKIVTLGSAAMASVHCRTGSSER